MRRNYHTTEDVTMYARLERIVSLSNVRLILPNTEHYRSVELSTTYGDWKELKENDEIFPDDCYVMPAYATGSDYQGDLVEASNHKAIIDMMPSDYVDGVEYLDYSGGHGTFAVAIRFDAITDEILETLEGLEDYPIIDEDLHSQLEMESQNEAWKDWGRSEFKTALGKAMFSAWESSPVSDQKDGETEDAYGERWDAVEDYLESECGEISDENLDDLFYKMTDFANVYWVNESGSGSYIDVDDVVKRGLDDSRLDSEWRVKAYAEICGLIRSGMSDRKYDLKIVPYVSPDQLTLPNVA